MLVVGLTGGISSGKSTVTELFLKRGVTVLDADQIVRQMQQPNTLLLKRLAATFGRDIILADGNLDRGGLGRLIFQDKAAKEKLDEIMKPLIREKLVQGIEEAEKACKAMVVLDMPLLYEFEFESLTDVTVVVYVSQETQIKRLMARDQIEEAYARSKISSQLSLDKKRDLANFVLVNEGDLSELRTQFETLYRQLEALS